MKKFLLATSLCLCFSSFAIADGPIVSSIDNDIPTPPNIEIVPGQFSNKDSTGIDKKPTTSNIEIVPGQFSNKDSTGIDKKFNTKLNEIYQKSSQNKVNKSKALSNKHFLFKELNLTQQQQDKIFEIKYKNIPVVRDYFKTLKNLSKKLENAKYLQNFDDKVAHEIIGEISKIQTLIHLNSFNTEKEIFNVLTPEQQQKFIDLKTQKKWNPIKKNK